VARRSRAGQHRSAGVVDRGAGSGKLLRRWRRRPPPRALLLLLLLSSLFLWCGDGGMEKGHGWLGFRAATSGFLWGDPRACGAGPDAERRCPASVPQPRGTHPAAAAQGLGFAARAAGARGKKGARAWAVTGLSRSGAARKLAGDASERGHGGEEKRKRGGVAVGAPCRGAGDAAEGSESEPGSRATAGGRGKLAGGTRPSAAPGGWKVKGRDASRWWARPWCWAGSRERKRERVCV
jgi:hypothetical protein